MKQLTTFGTMAIFFLLLSCKKEAASNQAISITGKWFVVNDSSFTGIGVNNKPVNYAGQQSDYFDFRSDGKLYIKEGINSDTLTYNLLSDTTIFIESFGIILNGVPQTSVIKNLTKHTVTIYTPLVITPGALSVRIMNLRR